MELYCQMRIVEGRSVLDDMAMDEGFGDSKGSEGVDFREVTFLFPRVALGLRLQCSWNDWKTCTPARTACVLKVSLVLP